MSFIKRRETLSILSNLIVFPLAVISGLWWPIEALPKWLQREQLIKAIHEVMRGNTIYSPELVVNMINTNDNPLTEREMTILDLAKIGKSSKEIAAQLFLADGTVRNYFSAIFSK